MDPNRNQPSNSQAQNKPPQPNLQTQTKQQSPPPSPLDNSQAQVEKTPIARSIIGIILLIFVPLIGLIFIWYLTKWPKWMKKLLLFLIIILPILIIILSVVVIALRPDNASSVPSSLEPSTNKTINYNKPSAAQSDSKRQSNLTQILNSIIGYSNDNGGELPAGITSVNIEISSSGADICSDLVDSYMPALPVDPSLGQIDITDCPTDYSTGYFIVKNNDGTLTLSAPNAETIPNVSITN